MEERRLPWKEEQLSLVQVELQVVCRHKEGDVGRRRRDWCLYRGVTPGDRQLVMCHLHGCGRKGCVSEGLNPQTVCAQREEDGPQDRTLRDPSSETIRI